MRQLIISSRVVGQLNSTFVNRFAIGIIDKDKVELGYIRDCVEVAKTAHLTLLKHETRPQYLITIYPAVDGFILDCAKDQGVDPKVFGIPSDLKSFTKEGCNIQYGHSIQMLICSYQGKY